MKASSKINHYRRKIMKSLTNNIGGSHKPKPLPKGKKLEIKQVLICRPNHRLGNLLLITPLIQEIETLFPDAKIDLLVQGSVAPFLFKSYTSIDRIIQLPKKPFKNLGKYLKGAFSIRKKRYDLVVNAVVGSSSGKIYTLLAASKYKVFNEISTEDKELHISKKQITSLRKYLIQLGISFENKLIPSLNFKLRPTEIKQGKELLDTLVPASKKTLCIYTFATGDKCYPKEWWMPFYERLLKEFGGNYNILEVLPMENVSQISFKAPTYYSKNIREMASVFANTEMYIGADCGIMHLASAAQIPVVGLFSRNNILMYEPYGNKSVGINTNTMNVDDYIVEIKKILN